MKRFYFSLLVCAGFLCGILPGVGCGKKVAPQDAKGLSTEETEGQWNEQLLEYAVKNLQRLDEFQGGEMRQLVIDRLNQWIRFKKLPADWQADPMVETLPRRLRDLPDVKNLGQLEFTRHDGLVLQEDVWSRDASTWARGSRLEDMARAKRLFDWTVRNIQIDQDSFGGELINVRKSSEPRAPVGRPGANTYATVKKIRQWPWETILLGRGTAVDRAWVFTLLLRQQGIDAVLLALPAETDGGDETRRPAMRIWAVGVLDQGKVYLFDPKLGLPIPASGGVKFSDGQLDIQPATLAEAAKDDSLLRQLDVDEGRPYPVKPSRLSKVVGFVVASPASMSARMAMFEDKLTGDERAVLTVDPSSIAQRFKDAGGLSEIRLWRRPFEVMLERDGITEAQQDGIDRVMAPFAAGGNRPLWRGRTLYLKGHFTGKDTATHFLQKARPSNRNMVALRNELLEIKRPAKQVDAQISAYRRGKQDATYWLGLMASLADDTRAATDYLYQRTLKAWPDGPWTSGAKYNLARAHESAGQLKEAVRWLKADTLSPSRRGNLLRAKWLEAELAAARARAEAQRKAEQTTLPDLPQ